MSRIAEIIMHLFLSIIIVVGFIVVVVLSALSVAADLVSIDNYRPPLLSDEDPDDDRETEDRSQQVTSSYAVDAQANRLVATDINAAH
jgi:hypothetical protein